MSYQPKIYRDQGGDRIKIAVTSGGNTKAGAFTVIVA